MEKKISLAARTGSMLKVDMRRMLRSRLFYIIIACALFIPVVMIVMLTMMDGTVSVNPQTGEESVMEGPDSIWQSIGTLPVAFEGSEAENASADAADGMAAMGAGMDVMAMCNINMMFMGVAVFICLFISEDFRSGYAKNLFTVRAKKGDYVISKTITGFICGAVMLIMYFVGSMLAGAISGLPFDLVGDMSALSVVMCMISKILLMLVFIPIFVCISVAAKQKAWLALCGSLGAGMLLFMMVGMITPLNATPVHVLLTAAGGAMFSFGLGAISKVILKKTSLV
ncbi:MAG: hypothetical protein E7611_07190 [Ruminococcaceae bacterium]|nr:hypothetical protein [Oscillospiraceae bacterium]